MSDLSFGEEFVFKAIVLNVLGFNTRNKDENWPGPWAEGSGRARDLLCSLVGVGDEPIFVNSTSLGEDELFNSI